MITTVTMMVLLMKLIIVYLFKIQTKNIIYLDMIYRVSGALIISANNENSSVTFFDEFLFLFYYESANPIGDACANDNDGDGVFDELDDCPRLKSVSSTSFDDHMLVDLARPSSTAQFPIWSVRDQVCRKYI